MQHDLPMLIFIGILYSFIAWLIFYQIEIRWNPIGRIKCRFGNHKYEVKKLGKVTKHFRCVRCDKPKATYLTLIEGGKKDFDVPFRF